MNIFLVGAGYNDDGSFAGEFVLIGRCSSFVPVIRDLNIYLSLKHDWWKDKYFSKIENWVTLKAIEEYRRYALEGNEADVLSRSLKPGNFQTWDMYLDEEDGEHVLSLSSMPWYLAVVSVLNNKIASILGKQWYFDNVFWPVVEWVNANSEELLELAIPEEHFNNINEVEEDQTS